MIKSAKGPFKMRSPLRNTNTTSFAPKQPSANAKAKFKPKKGSTAEKITEGILSLNLLDPRKTIKQNFKEYGF
tara:strand:- start:407 stop:625 length:219 start_codon:yes stop_codon:yes gene_type:complete